MSLDEIRPRVEAWRAEGTRHAVAVLTGAWRSAPRRPGARFARSETGEIAGNVSAGCVEADLAERLDRVLSGEPATRIAYDVSDDAARDVGLACGGRIELFLEAFEPDDPLWPALYARRDARSTVLLLTDLEPSAASHWLLDDEGRVVETDVPDAAPPDVAVAAGLGLLDVGGVRVVGSTGETPGPEVEGGMLVEVVLPPRRLVVVGSTPVGASLARLARAADIPVEVVEPRAGYAAGLDGTGIGVDPRWPDEALPDLEPDRSTAVAVVAHDARLDVAALATALATEAGYVGLLGGGRTRRARFDALAEKGIGRQRIGRIRAPIGLDIGAELPAEIAVAILGQVIAAWRGAE